MLTDLPPELFERIFIHLKTRDIFACAATCKLLQGATTSPLVQYQIELELAGLEDGPARSSDLKTRRLAVSTYRRRWNTLDWRTPIRAPFWDNGNIWDLCGGIFGQGNVGTRGRAFHFTRLPSHARGVKTIESWDFKNIGVKDGVRDFTFVPSLDLLVLLDMTSWPLTVHFRTLSTNETHPLAAKPVFKYMRENVQTHLVRDESFYLQVMDDVFAVLRLPRGLTSAPLHSHNELVIGNWKTGELLTTVMTPNLALLTFSFVSPQYVLLGVGEDDNVPDFFPIPRDPRIQVYKFDSKTPAPATLACTLELPPMEAHHRVGFLLARSDPPPDFAVPSERPFGVARDDRLLVLTLAIRKDTLEMVEIVNFFVLMSTLIELSAHTKEQPPTYEFLSWADRARVLPTRQEMTWVCYVYGTRFIVALDKPGERGLVNACVFDFNQMEVRHSIHEKSFPVKNDDDEEEADEEMVIVDEDSSDSTNANWDDDPEDDEGWEDDTRAKVDVVNKPTLHYSESFARPIFSALPFRRLVSPVELNCTALMLDEDNIVCVKEDDPRRLVFLPL